MLNWRVDISILERRSTSKQNSIASCSSALAFCEHSDYHFFTGKMGFVTERTFNHYCWRQWRRLRVWRPLKQNPKPYGASSTIGVPICQEYEYEKDEFHPHNTLQWHVLEIGYSWTFTSVQPSALSTAISQGMRNVVSACCHPDRVHTVIIDPRRCLRLLSILGGTP